MFGKTKSLFLIVASMLCMASCDSIREELPRCELWLEFVFDYNMEYADAFNPQVKSVDVLVFDSDDKLLFTKSAKVAALVGGNRMSLTDELDFGSYKVLTVGSLSDRFRLSDNAGNKLAQEQPLSNRSLYPLSGRRILLISSFSIFTSEKLSKWITCHSIPTIKFIR